MNMASSGSEQGSDRERFDDLFAVVLNADYGGDRVRWDAEVQEWLCSDEWGYGFRRQEAPHRVGTGEWTMRSRVYGPSVSDVQKAHSIVADLVRDRMCQWCGRGEVRFHGIAPTVFGDPELVCLFRADPRCVASFGGGGRAKHWGSTWGCRYVRGESVGVPGRLTLKSGYLLYGEPLDAFEVFDRPWCNTCTGTAWNVWTQEVNRLRDALSREPEADEVLGAILEREQHMRKADWLCVLLRELDGRSVAQIRAEIGALTYGDGEK